MARTPENVKGGMLGVEDSFTIDSSTTDENSTIIVPPRVGILTIQVVVTGTVAYMVHLTCDPSTVDHADRGWFPLDSSGNFTGAIQRPLYGAISYIWVEFVSGTGSLAVSFRGQ